MTASKMLNKKEPKMARLDRINTSSWYITAVLYAYGLPTWHRPRMKFLETGDKLWDKGNFQIHSENQCSQ